MHEKNVVFFLPVLIFNYQRYGGCQMDNKLVKLELMLQQFDKVAIAFSGGIDSAFLLAEAKRILGAENVLAVVVNSELFRDSEFNKAIEMAQNMGVGFIGTEIRELADPDISNNTPNGWYRSKKLLYQVVKEAAREKNIQIVMDGMIMDDNDDFRPGLKARDEEGVLSPLQAVEIYKSEIRESAKTMNLPIWGKPASCSVASRFPYYTEITEEKIKKVMEGEQFLNNLGFSVVRLRYHDSIARIEVEEDRLADLIENRVIINQYLKELGFEYVALDVSGYQMGRMNEELLEANAI